MIVPTLTPFKIRISQELYGQTLTAMSESGRITTHHDPNSDLLLIINFRPNFATAGLELAEYYRVHGNPDQRRHANSFLWYYSEQQHTLARRDFEPRDTIHERNFKANEKPYNPATFRTSSYNTPSVPMRRELRELDCLMSDLPPDRLSEPIRASRSQYGRASTSGSSEEPVQPQNPDAQTMPIPGIPERIG